MKEKIFYRTRDIVAENGEYICKAGKIQSYKKGDTFSHCPVTGKETTWKPYVYNSPPS
ncbi:hypothetical protein WD019_04760 [Fictibacillus sp. Mic-4]|uniref:hypothetical protein n=1 Tax=Fictibacillus sp. Mic-4 TaxID=3132826 RepID=UPI003CF8B02C